MKNLIVKFFSFIMTLCGISIEDLVAYRNNQSVPQVSSEPESVNKLPLEILYENNYRSFFVEKDKKPVAIICDNIGFAFEDAPEYMNWYEAEEYCEQYSVGGKNWQLPNKEAGHLDTLYKNKESINVILKALSKEPLKESWYWASEYYGNGAWIIRFSDGSVDWYGKGSNYGCVRPVTNL